MSAADPVTPTQLRADLFHLLDQVLESGEPLAVRRKGQVLRIVPETPVSKFDRLVPHPDAVVGDSDDLAEISWAEAWDADRALNP